MTVRYLVEVNEPTYKLLLKKAREMREAVGIEVSDEECIVTILDELVDYLDKIEV